MLESLQEKRRLLPLAVVELDSWAGKQVGLSYRAFQTFSAAVALAGTFQAFLVLFLSMLTLLMVAPLSGLASCSD